MIIKASTTNPDKLFNFEGLDYQKDYYIITYGNKQLLPNRDIDINNVTVGLRHRNDFKIVLSKNKPVTEWSNGSQVFTDVIDLIAYITSLINFQVDTNIGLTQKVNSFSDLVSGVLEGDLAYVENSEGTAWLPGTVGGSYYPKGWYVWNGTDWISDRNAIANQFEQNILTLADKANTSDLGDVAFSNSYNDLDDLPPGGSQGPAGEDGKSAYEVALDNGFVGTEQEWLDSIKGSDGNPGQDGNDGQDGAQGPKGDTGPAGSDGVDGNEGSQGPKGDTGDIGPQGIQGDAGTDGNDGTNGTDGLGFTGGSYDSGSGVVTFTSDDGLGFATSDLRGADGIDGTDGIDGVDGLAQVSSDADNIAVIGSDGFVYVPPGIPNSGSANLNYLFTSTVTPENTLANTFQVDNTDLSLVTKLYLSETSYANVQVGNILSLMKDGDAIYIQQDNDDSKFLNANITGPGVLNGTTYEFPIQVISSGDLFTLNSITSSIIYHSSSDGGGDGDSSGLTESAVGAIAAGSTLGLQQSLLANSGQPALTVLAVGFTDTGKVQGVSLGDGNVVEVYANGTDFNNGVVLYREFMSLGEPICFTGLTNGAIITGAQGFYGFSEQANGSQVSPMPLLSYGLSFKETFFFAFRNSQGGSSSRGFARIVNGPLKSLVTMTRGNGDPVSNGEGLEQTNIEVEPWGFLSLETDANTEFIIKSTNPVMACVHAEMRDSSPRYYDSRLIMPLTNDGITWPRSGNVSAPYNNTLVKYYVRDGAKGEFTVSPSSPVDFDGATGATESDYESNGATRVRAVGLISAYSGADSAGLEASPLMPTQAMSQVVAQPLFIRNTGDGGDSSVSISSPYEGNAKVYSWDFVNSELVLEYSFPLTRNGVTITTKDDQNHPAAGQLANESSAAAQFSGDLDAGIVIADVPITVVVQTNSGYNPVLRSQNGSTTTAILNNDDETLSLGLTPPELKVEITEGSDGLLYRRVVNAGVVTFELA